MNNTNQDEKKEEQSSIYNIPGVIIPKQVTDSGVVLGTDNTEETLADVPSETTKTDSATTNQNDSQTNNDTSNNNQTSNPDKVDIKTPPILPGMPAPQKEEEPPKGVKVKKKKAEGNAKIGCLSLLVIVLLGVVLYFVYITYINPPKVSSKDKEDLQKQVFNKESYIVNELFNFVNTTGCNSRNNIIYNDKQTVSITDLTQEDKNYLAYRSLKQNVFSKKYCKNYASALNSKSKEKEWYCGDNYLYSTDQNNYDDSNDLTLIFSKNELQKQVEKMFGEGEYADKTFKIDESSRYLFDKTTENYILQTKYGTDECTNYTNTLGSVTNDDNNIILNVKVTNEKTENQIVYHYRFVKTENGNYYFQEVTKGD